MCTPDQFGHDLFHILLYGNGGRDLLLERTLNAYRFPVVTVPRHTRIAQEITTAVKSLWNLDAYCLFELPMLDDSEEQTRFQLAEAPEPTRIVPAGMQWLPVNSLSTATFEQASEYAIVEKALTALDDYRLGRLPGTFGKLGWLQEVTDWVREQASAVGLILTGKFCQLNASPTFSLLRFETGGPALWFKAVGEPNLHEYSITLELAERFPQFVPKIVGRKPDCNAWLALEAKGEEISPSSAQSAWTSTAENLALLQVSSFGRRFELIEAGCTDLRPCRLAALVDPFIEAMNELIQRQASQRVEPLTRRELHALCPILTSSIREIEESPIPSVLGHLDMNPGNIVASPTHCTFLDWAEAYVGPPFLTFEYLLAYFRRFRGVDRSRERAMRSAYANPWARLASWKEIASAFRMTPLLAVFAYAARGARSNDAKRANASIHGYLRALTRRMKREAEKLSERRLACAL